MSAQDNLRPEQFYHGTAASLSPGMMLTPEGANDFGRNETNDEQGYSDHVYFTPRKIDAKRYAWGRAFNTSSPSDIGHVYSVQPQGDYERDPGRHNKGGLRTKSGLRVISEVAQVHEGDRP